MEALTTPSSPCYKQISTATVLQTIRKKNTEKNDSNGKGFALKLDSFVIFLMQGKAALWAGHGAWPRRPNTM